MRGDTVDGRNPAPNDKFYTSQVVQDFFRQQKCANQLIPMRFRLDHVKYVTVHQKEAPLTSDLHCSKYPRKSVFQQEIYVYKLQTFHDFPVLQVKWCSARLHPVLESFNWIPLPQQDHWVPEKIQKSERIQNEQTREPEFTLRETNSESATTKMNGWQVLVFLFAAHPTFSGGFCY